MPNNDAIRTSIKQEYYIETKDGVVTSAHAPILSVELYDLIMLDKRYTPITEDEWLSVVDYLCVMIGPDLHEHLGAALDAIRDARLKKHMREAVDAGLEAKEKGKKS